jgi:hypothetical protein
VEILKYEGSFNATWTLLTPKDTVCKYYSINTLPYTALPCPAAIRTTWELDLLSAVVAFTICTNFSLAYSLVSNAESRRFKIASNSFSINFMFDIT